MRRSLPEKRSTFREERGSHVHGWSTRTATLAVFSVLGMAPPALAAQWTVDDDRGDCPAAQFTSVQGAVDAAAAGDTIAICPGTYREGAGTAGSNAVTINKSLTLKGAGANLV